jgi:hypothetical protein
MTQYKDIVKSFKKERYDYYLSKFKNKADSVNLYKKIRYNYLTKKNKAPDVSTITEHIAFVIDGQVVEIIHCQPKMAAILLSGPEIVQIPEDKIVKPGWGYKDEQFTAPEAPTQQPQAQDDLSTFKDYFDRVKNKIAHPEKTLSFKDFSKKLKERK